ncbi:hypothetical protein FOFC_11059, partial [Fusarium oxysporum]
FCFVEVMYRRFIAPLLAVFCFLLVVTSLYLGRDHLTWRSGPYTPVQQEEVETGPSLTLTTTVATTSAKIEESPSHTPTPTATANLATTPTISNGTILSAERISRYIAAIFNSSAALPRLECPALNYNRYKVLQEPRHGDEVQDSHIDYFFALNLRNCIGILPRLIGSIVEAVRFLGPHRCALSIVEGNSPDGTSDILSALKPFLEDLGLVYFYNSSRINPTQGNARIRKLAQLRNLALTPLYKEPVKVTDETTVLFINDVSACTEDILELALQRRSLNADMTCAMDWTYVGPDPTFYDIWIARTISGDSRCSDGKIFSNSLLEDAVSTLNTTCACWTYRTTQPFSILARTFFWIAPKFFTEIGIQGTLPNFWNLDTRERPSQVFAERGYSVTAAPLLHGLRFRDTRKGECFQ